MRSMGTTRPVLFGYHAPWTISFISGGGSKESQIIITITITIIILTFRGLCPSTLVDLSRYHTKFSLEKAPVLRGKNFS
ncbi:hypothetical protein CJ030_MR2G016179 [Morella rubra]|uniref:Uncharacterized protein n=1 Tax=Morella rubra TaxID=262757 RepID=A0A6A1WF28_9ROSI|nr:hypothetical protein CJ030_MR2G016179 [Morella rubra]